MAKTLLPDDLLGKDLTFYHDQGCWLVKRSVMIVAYEPRTAWSPSRWRLVGPGFAAAWVDDETLKELFEEGVLA